ncbi:hypothetical protein FLM48_17395 [Shewanella sp. Scap07]|uniref:hypothetical protein n=1 Tax=Shewanella sp. Scap07 TaxID=2589987 RepID=UPI0015B7A450|nr:hypothetical protein [Shewanella sp. Scap07]QLE86691.1 hypothetical protein FLM48_17395 [Shewanella sp. Scap07]
MKNKLKFALVAMSMGFGMSMASTSVVAEISQCAVDCNRGYGYCTATPWSSPQVCEQKRQQCLAKC